jgi:hypothetical protein
MHSRSAGDAVATRSPIQDSLAATARVRVRHGNVGTCAPAREVVSATLCETLVVLRTVSAQNSQGEPRAVASGASDARARITELGYRQLLPFTGGSCCAAIMVSAAAV